MLVSTRSCTVHACARVDSRGAFAICVALLQGKLDKKVKGKRATGSQAQTTMVTVTSWAWQPPTTCYGVALMDV